MNSTNLSRTAVALLLGLAVLLPATGTAQDWKGRGRIQGEVTDERGAPVAAASVTLRWGVAPDQGPAPLATDRKGKWSFLGLVGGAWIVLVEAPGFVPQEGSVQVNEFGAVPPIKMKLRPAEASAAPVDPAVAAIEEGNRLLGEGRHAEARAAYERSLADLPAASRPAVMRAVARTWFDGGDAARAITVLEESLALAPDDAESLRLIVTLLVAAGREADARAYMARLPAGAEVDADTLLNLGIDLYNQNRLEEALAEFDRVVTQQPTLPDAYYYRGLARLGLGRGEEAKADFQKLLDLDPSHAKAEDCRQFLSSL